MRAMLIVNPSSGPWDVRRELPAVLNHLEDHGWRATLHQTSQPGEATEIARRAADGNVDAVFVVGGDGTINEVVNGLAESPVAMGVLPGGTGNVWAKELGLPTRSALRWLPLRDSIRSLVPGNTRRIDLGRANGRYFLQWTGLGLDAEVTYAMEPRSRTQRRLGVLGYIVAGFATVSTMVGIRSRIWIDGRLTYRRCILIVVSNSPLYGGMVRLSSDTRLDDGQLDISVFSGSGFISVMRTFFGVITGLHSRDPRHTSFQGRQIRIETDKPMAVHVDGDPFGSTPLDCQVVPRALTIILPKQVRPDLFAAAPPSPAATP